jgi:hypothetical protein
MAEETKLPLAVSTSGGMSGVSPKVSMMEDAVAKTADALSSAVQALMVPSPLVPAASAEAVKTQVESASALMERMVRVSQHSAQSYASALMEMTRVNAQKTIELAQDLASAKSPADVFSVQSAYWEDQRKTLAKNAAEFQDAFLKFFAAVSQRPAS